MQNNVITKPINCTLCKSVVRERYVDFHTCELKINGSEIKVSLDARLEIVDLEGVEETTTLKKSLDIQSYKTRHENDEELLRAYLAKHIIKSSHLDTRQHPERVSNALG